MMDFALFQLTMGCLCNEFTPGGVESTFVSSGLFHPYALAFNSAGDLFEADRGSGNIYEFTPNGTQSTFASGLNNNIWGLAFENTSVSVPDESSTFVLLGVGTAVLFFRRLKYAAALNSTTQAP